MNPIEEIKARLDLVDLISETVNLRKSGRSYSGFCPFHSNTRTPSFVVFPETQTWRCFGACADGGDLFTYYMKREALEFREALVQLAARAGVQLEAPDPQKNARRDAEAHLAELLDAAADYFHQLFLHAPQAQSARSYIENRGFTAETIDIFRVGFALNSWNATRDHFLGQGYTEDDMIAVGLLTVNEEKGTRYDRFRNRLMIPISDLNERVVGFGARTLDPDGIPKYLNSPQTMLFDKSNLLFGLDMAKRHIREARQAVIVEGYMDVIMAWQGGFRNVIAQMGTALTPTQLNILKKVTRRFVIALDADAAGVKATLRSLDVARKTLDREEELRFDPTGLIQEEGRLQADIRVVSMPEGEDPDSIIRQDPAIFARLIEGAKPVVAYVIDVLTEQYDLDDPKNKTQLAEQIIPLIRDIPSPIEREHYWQLLARTLRIDDRALRQLYIPDEQRPVVQNKKKRVSAQTPPRDRPVLPAGRARSRGDVVKKREENFLRETITDPLLIRQINRRLSQEGQHIVHAEDFSAAVDRTLFVRLNQQQSQGLVASLDDLWDSLESPLRQRVEQLMLLPPADLADRDKLPERLVISVLVWRQEKANQLNDELKLLIREAKLEADSELVRVYTKQHTALTRQIYQLNQAKASIKGVGRRRS